MWILEPNLTSWGVYFPVDGKLGVEFAQKNDLLRRKDENGNPAGGYLDPEKRNIKALKLRGEKSDGLFLPISCMEGFIDTSLLKEGDTISVVNGITICEKYIPKRNRSGGSPGGGSRVRKKSDPISPLFMEHADTEQLAYNLSAFRAGDLVEITLKMHGTSQRTGYLPVLQGYKYKNGLQKRLFESDKTPNWLRSMIERTPIYDWGYVTGTRRVVYGCDPTGKKTTADGSGVSAEPVPKSDIYVYRMTMTNEDGDVVEYPPDFMRYRCEQMGVKCVPLFWRCFIPDMVQLPDAVGSPQAVDAGEYIKAIAERYYDGPDPVGKTHIREGVVCRIVNRPKFAAYKHKNFYFKALEGLIKDTAAAPDMEEAQEVEVMEEEG